MASVAVVLGLAGASRGDDLEKQLLKEAPEIIRTLRAKGYQNVGVLKFRVKKGDEAITDRAGPLNVDLAQRLEMALVLSLRPQEPLGIIRDASHVAATIPGASHLSAEGRQKFFSAVYPLVWGNTTVHADAFVTGVVQVGDDLKQLRISVGAFGRAGELEKVVQFTAAMDSQRLADVGESFVVRGVFDDDVVEQVAMNDASRVRQSLRDHPHPVLAADAPVELQITYNGQLVPIDVRNGKALVREPAEGQRVALILKRKNAADTLRYACVLKVNGLNTLEKERLPDLQCHKWVLDPGAPPITVPGFQRGGATAEAFRVLSKAASQARQMDYGDDVGTISLVVFRERHSEARPGQDLLDENAEDLAALTRGTYPEPPTASLAALQAQMRTNVRRNLIEEGDSVPNQIRKTTFDPLPTPVMSETITYYRP